MLSGLAVLIRAAHDGRLEEISGIGYRRALAIRDSVGAILKRSTRRRALKNRQFGQASAQAGGETSFVKPAIDDILEVDRAYRRQAAAGKLKTIAPRRFNPGKKSWLPIMHSEKNGWHFTAMFSNTARAHDLKKIRDWVVVYFEHDGDEGQCTVVTEQGGPLKGKRVVRGRESACRAHYTKRDPF